MSEYIATDTEFTEVANAIRASSGTNSNLEWPSGFVGALRGSVPYGLIADNYDQTSTYEVGEYCIHDYSLYRCITPITTAEDWDSDHWKQVTLGEDISDLENDLTTIEADIKATTEAEKAYHLNFYYDADGDLCQA